MSQNKRNKIKIKRNKSEMKQRELNFQIYFGIQPLFLA